MHNFSNVSNAAAQCTQSWCQEATTLPPVYGVALSQDPELLKLDTTVSGQATLYYPDGNSIVFPMPPQGGAGILPGQGPYSAYASSESDANGNTITFGGNISMTACECAGPPTTITDSLGRVVTLSYNSQNELTSITYTDSSGTLRAITLSYKSVVFNPTFTNPSPSVVYMIGGTDATYQGHSLF